MVSVTLLAFLAAAAFAAQARDVDHGFCSGDDSCQVNKDPEGYTLQHVHLLQRHSIRAPSRICDRWSNITDFPMGLGYLTKNGKQGALKVGKILRRFYGKFLDDNPHNVWARSSTYPRCYETLSLLLNSLFPPRGFWNFGYPVQPVPIIMVPDKNDVVIADCVSKAEYPYPPNFEHIYNLTDPALQKDNFKNLGEFIEYVTKASGFPTNSTTFFKPIIDAMYAQRYSQVPIPAWAEQKWSSMDFAMRKLSLEYYAYDTPYYASYAGKLIAERLQKAVEPSEEKKKLSVMNYHDTNIQAILTTLKMDSVALYPSFLATMHFQLYKKNSDGTFWVRTMYHQGFTADGNYRPPLLLDLPGCTFPNCPLDTFVKMMSSFYPNVDRSKCPPINRQALL